MKTQEIQIYLDDSGKLTEKELFTIYAGLVFTDKKKMQEFHNIYKSAVNNIKCNYCNKTQNDCDNTCPEIKHNMLRKKDIRRLINIIKKYTLTACIITNSKVYPEQKSSKASKGRYLDFCIKMMVKNVVIQLIKSNIIDETQPLTIRLNLDEQTTKSNGYYSLDESIKEELETGFRNFNYNVYGKPVIYNKVNVILQYKHSINDFYVQGADLIAGYTRRVCIKDNEEKHKKLNFIDYKVFLP